MFTSHLDTASSQLKEVHHVINGDIIRTDGSSILGADDKAGVTIMMFMIENNITGLYYFFLGEEVGCVGSRKVSSVHKKTPLPNITKVVSFDRRGYDSVITYQFGGRCCSDTFGNALAKELNNNGVDFKYSVDPTGIYTDSAQFIDIYPECTNISVGYKNEHTSSEQQDIKHLIELCHTVIKVDWENLPIDRNPKIQDIDEYDDYYYPRSTRSTSTSSYTPTASNTSINTWTSDHYFTDPLFEIGNNYVSINKYTKQLTNIQLSKQRLEYEEEQILNLLESLELEYIDLEWNGNTLTVTYEDGQETISKRSEMAEYISDLNFWTEIVKI
jgi:hypothetical protein